MKQKLVIALMTCTLLQPQVCWANETSNQLEKVIQIVKSKVEVSSKLSEFSYRLYDETFNLTWRSKDDTESIDISCTQDGNLLSYYHFTEDELGDKVAAVDVDEAKQMAKDFLNKIVPEYAQSLEDVNWQLPSKGEDYDFSFYLTHDGVPVYDHLVNISVDKQTGNIAHFNGIKFDEAAQYDDAVPILDLEEAQTFYLSEIGLPLGYRTYFDDNDDKKAFLAYYLERKDDAISSKNGKKVKRYMDDETMYAGSAKDAGASVENSQDTMVAPEELSPAEVKAVENTKAYMSLEAIKEKLATYFPILGSMTIFNTSIQNDHLGDRRYMNMGIKQEGEITANADLSCDAKTGEIYDYNYYSYNEVQNIEGEKWTKEQAEAFIKKVNPDKSKEVTLTSEATNDYNKNLQTFKFTRLYNDIAVCGDGIELTYNTSLKQVTNYRVNWGKNISFPSHKGILSKEDMVKEIGLTLYYMQTGEHDYSLVYTTQENNNNLFDAFSGKPVNWQGKEKVMPSNSFYTDIKGHKAETIITRLYNSGIYLEGPMLKPDEAITQQEFIRLLNQATAWFDDDMSTYEIAVSQGILGEDEKAPEKQLTREEGIKYIINTTPYEKLAVQSDLYQYPYKDGDVSEDLKGYVTVAYGLNIIDAQSQNFSPKAKLTKAEAMVMIYNLLQNS